MGNVSLELVWIARQSYRGGAVIPRSPRQYHFLFVICGTGAIEAEGKMRRAQEGQYVLFAPDPLQPQPYRIVATENRPLCTIELRFRCEPSELQRELRKLPPIAIVSDLAAVRTELELAEAEVEAGHPYGKELATAHIMAMLYLLLREACLRPVDSPRLERAMSPPEREQAPLAVVAEHIQRHFSQEVSLQQLSELVHLSISQMCKLFKRSYGVSPIKYVHQLRIRQARHLLEHSEYSVSQISERVGFSSLHYFSRFFKQYEQLSPNEYRFKKRTNIHIFQGEQKRT